MTDDSLSVRIQHVHGHKLGLLTVCSLHANMYHETAYKAEVSFIKPQLILPSPTRRYPIAIPINMATSTSDLPENKQVVPPFSTGILDKICSCLQIREPPGKLKHFFAEHRTLEGFFDNVPDGERTPLFQFGVVADVQYASAKSTIRSVSKRIINGRVVYEKRRRAFRETLPKLENALHAFNKAELEFVVNLGDTIDGYRLEQYAKNFKDFESVAFLIKRLSKSRVYHVLGNHCRCLPALTLKSLLQVDPYYSFHPTPKWRFIALDSSELCTSLEQTTQGRLELLNIIVSEGRLPHHFHGAIGEKQMEWFKGELDAAQEKNENVVILSHYPLADGSARPSHVIANTKKLRELIERPGSPVVLCLSGHDHVGGFLRVPKTPTRRAILYLTMPAILEAPKDSNAYAMVTVYSDNVIHIDGYGTAPTFLLGN